MKAVLGAATSGACSGASTSLVNDVSSPYGTLGEPVARSGWAWVGEIAQWASLLVDLGWSWAALAVIVGWAVDLRSSRNGRAWARAAAGGVAALVAALMAHYGMDSLLENAPFDMYWPEIRQWAAVSLLFGPLLGVAGACANRPGIPKTLPWS
ncbi:hypothetical protein [Thermoactinospora rubra]|uniref:hypothetical protein n=1 Tax=Thermoactinospora rubra TaxID=1088767 RepID=UPI001301CB0D|nr:hypothetical protein [Thermoactinospora rubra]